MTSDPKVLRLTFGYRGFNIWFDSDAGWFAERVLTGDRYEITDCKSKLDAIQAVNELVDAWVAGSILDHGDDAVEGRIAPGDEACLNVDETNEENQQ